MNTGFWSRKLGELEALWSTERVERYGAILPVVERLAQLEAAGSTDTAVWRRDVERITQKILDEWPFDDEHGLEMLRYAQALRKGKS